MSFIAKKPCYKKSIKIHFLTICKLLFFLFFLPKYKKKYFKPWSLLLDKTGIMFKSCCSYES